MPAVARHALVPFRVREMYALVADVASYPRWFDWCLAAHVTRHEDGSELARLDVSIAGLRTSFATRNVMVEPESIELRLEDGPLRSLHGFWRFKRLGHKGCKVSLELGFELSPGVLDTVIQIGFMALGNRMLDDFVRVAKEQYG